MILVLAGYVKVDTTEKGLVANIGIRELRDCVAAQEYCILINSVYYQYDGDKGRGVPKLFLAFDIR